MKKNHTFTRTTVAAVVFIFSGVLFAATAPKYVFLFIGDGMNTAQRMLANEYMLLSDKPSLAMNNLEVAGFARTSSASTRITDSAAAGTALACGVKTRNGTLGLDHKGARVESCAEVAKRAGKKVGIITTVTVTHATPAAFYAHTVSRRNNDTILKQLGESKFDYFAGGGIGEKDEYYKFVETNGYHLVTSPDEFKSLKNDGRKYLAYFSKSAMGLSIDTKGSDMPTVAQLVEKAIDVLDNEKGFFIMCEGGLIDHAAHCNDPGGTLHDVLALDDAVKVALDFYKRHKEDTLIVVTGDHETGGLAIGLEQEGYTPRVELLANQKKSVTLLNVDIARVFAEKREDIVFDDIIPVLKETVGFDFGEAPKRMTMTLKPKEITLLKETFEKDVKRFKSKVKETDDYLLPKIYRLGNVAVKMLDKRCGINWNTIGHSSLPVLTTAQGAGAEKFIGFYENSYIGTVLKEYLSK